MSELSPLNAPPFITSVRQAKYNENGTIDCEIQFQGSTESDGVTPLYLPYTASPSDLADYGVQLYADLVAGKYGAVTPFVVTAEMLEAEKQAKREEINSWRDAQENAEYVFSYDGHNWDYGKKTQERMSISLVMAQRNALPKGFAWTDADNEIIPIDNAGLIALSKAIEDAMFQKGMEINLRQLQMKAEVGALTTLDAVRRYPVGWQTT